MKSLLHKVFSKSTSEVKISSDASSNPDFSDEKEKEAEMSYSEYLNQSKSVETGERVTVSMTEV